MALKWGRRLKLLATEPWSYQGTRRVSLIPSSSPLSAERPACWCQMLCQLLGTKLLSLPAWNCTPNTTKGSASPGAWCPIMLALLPTQIGLVGGKLTLSSVQLPHRPWR